MFISDKQFERAWKRRERQPWKLYLDSALEYAKYLMKAEPYRANVTSHNWPLLNTRTLQARVFVLAGLYRLTKEKRYARRAWFFLEDALQWEHWYWPDKNERFVFPFDLSTGELAMTLGVALDWLQGGLPQKHRQQLLQAIEKRIFRNYLDSCVYFEPHEAPVFFYHCHHNWNMVCNGSAYALALYLEDESPLAKEVQTVAEEGMRSYIEQWHEDGSSEEGIGYWNYGIMYFAYTMMTYEHLKKKKHPALDMDAFRNGLDFPFDFAPGGVGLSFGDVNRFKPESFIFMLAERMKKPEIAKRARRGVVARLKEDAAEAFFESSRAGDLILNFLVDNGARGSEVERESSELRVYPDNGWGLFKHEDVSLSFRAGTNCVNHSLRDLNAIQLAKRGVGLLQNIGNGTYSLGWFYPDADGAVPRHMYFEDQTNSKNSMLFNGIGQIRRSDTRWSANEKSMVCDAVDAYPDFVKRAKRRVSLLKAGFGLKDEFAVTRGAWCESRFVTRGRFENLDDSTVLVVNEGESMRMVFSSDVELSIVIAEQSLSLPNQASVQILRVTSKKAVNQCWIGTKLLLD